MNLYSGQQNCHKENLSDILLPPSSASTSRGFFLNGSTVPCDPGELHGTASGHLPHDSSLLGASANSPSQPIPVPTSPNGRTQLSSSVHSSSSYLGLVKSHESRIKCTSPVLGGMPRPIIGGLPPKPRVSDSIPGAPPPKPPPAFRAPAPVSEAPPPPAPPPIPGTPPLSWAPHLACGVHSARPVAPPPISEAPSKPTALPPTPELPPPAFEALSVSEVPYLSTPNHDYQPLDYTHEVCIAREHQIPEGNIEFTDEEVGSGSYGYVVVVRYKGRKCAAKQLHSLLCSNDELIAAFLRECETCATLDHPNIVKFVGICVQQETTPILITELMDQSLYHLLHEKKALLSLHDKLSVAQDVACALSYIHEHGFIHRDIASTNILLTSDNRAKLGDFGTARHSMSQNTQCPGHICYMAEEALSPKSEHNSSLDMFSFCVLLIEIVTQQYPNPSPSQHNQSEAIRRKEHISLLSKMLTGPSDGLRHSMMSFIQQCLGQPKERPTASEAMKQIAFMMSLVGAEDTPSHPESEPQVRRIRVVDPASSPSPSGLVCEEDYIITDDPTNSPSPDGISSEEEEHSVSTDDPTGKPGPLCEEQESTIMMDDLISNPSPGGILLEEKEPTTDSLASIPFCISPKVPFSSLQSCVQIVGTSRDQNVTKLKSDVLLGLETHYPPLLPSKRPFLGVPSTTNLGANPLSNDPSNILDLINLKKVMDKLLSKGCSIDEQPTLQLGSERYVQPKPITSTTLPDLLPLLIKMLCETMLTTSFFCDSACLEGDVKGLSPCLVQGELALQSEDYGKCTALPARFDLCSLSNTDQATNHKTTSGSAFLIDTNQESTDYNRTCTPALTLPKSFTDYSDSNLDKRARQTLVTGISRSSTTSTRLAAANGCGSEHVPDVSMDGSVCYVSHHECEETLPPSPDAIALQLPTLDHRNDLVIANSTQQHLKSSLSLYSSPAALESSKSSTTKVRVTLAITSNFSRLNIKGELCTLSTPSLRKGMKQDTISPVDCNKHESSCLRDSRLTLLTPSVLKCMKQETIAPEDCRSCNKSEASCLEDSLSTPSLPKCTEQETITPEDCSSSNDSEASCLGDSRIEIDCKELSESATQCIQPVPFVGLRSDETASNLALLGKWAHSLFKPVTPRNEINIRTPDYWLQCKFSSIHNGDTTVSVFIDAEMLCNTSHQCSITHPNLAIQISKFLVCLVDLFFRLKHHYAKSVLMIAKTIFPAIGHNRSYLPKQTPSSLVSQRGATCQPLEYQSNHCTSESSHCLFVYVITPNDGSYPLIMDTPLLQTNGICKMRYILDLFLTAVKQFLSACYAQDYVYQKPRRATQPVLTRLRNDSAASKTIFPGEQTRSLAKLVIPQCDVLNFISYSKLDLCWSLNIQLQYVFPPNHDDVTTVIGIIEVEAHQELCNVNGNTQPKQTFFVTLLFQLGQMVFTIGVRFIFTAKQTSSSLISQRDGIRQPLEHRSNHHTSKSPHSPSIHITALKDGSYSIIVDTPLLKLPSIGLCKVRYILNLSPTVVKQDCSAEYASSIYFSYSNNHGRPHQSKLQPNHPFLSTLESSRGKGNGHLNLQLFSAIKPGCTFHNNVPSILTVPYSYSSFDVSKQGGSCIKRCRALIICSIRDGTQQPPQQQPELYASRDLQDLSSSNITIKSSAGLMRGISVCTPSPIMKKDGSCPLECPKLFPTVTKYCSASWNHSMFQSHLNGRNGLHSSNIPSVQSCCSGSSSGGGGESQSTQNTADSQSCTSSSHATGAGNGSSGSGGDGDGSDDDDKRRRLKSQCEADPFQPDEKSSCGQFKSKSKPRTAAPLSCGGRGRSERLDGSTLVVDRDMEAVPKESDGWHTAPSMKATLTSTTSFLRKLYTPLNLYAKKQEAISPENSGSSSKNEASCLGDSRLEVNYKELSVQCIQPVLTRLMSDGTASKPTLPGEQTCSLIKLVIPHDTFIELDLCYSTAPQLQLVFPPNHNNGTTAIVIITEAHKQLYNMSIQCCNTQPKQMFLITLLFQKCHCANESGQRVLIIGARFIFTTKNTSSYVISQRGGMHQPFQHRFNLHTSNGSHSPSIHIIALKDGSYSIIVDTPLLKLPTIGLCKLRYSNLSPTVAKQGCSTHYLHSISHPHSTSHDRPHQSKLQPNHPFFSTPVNGYPNLQFEQNCSFHNDSSFHVFHLSKQGEGCTNHCCAFIICSTVRQQPLQHQLKLYTFRYLRDLSIASYIITPMSLKCSAGSTRSHLVCTPSPNLPVMKNDGPYQLENCPMLFSAATKYYSAPLQQSVILIGHEGLHSSNIPSVRSCCGGSSSGGGGGGSQSTQNTTESQSCTSSSHNQATGAGNGSSGSGGGGDGSDDDDKEKRLKCQCEADPIQLDEESSRGQLKSKSTPKAPQSTLSSGNTDEATAAPLSFGGSGSGERNDGSKYVVDGGMEAVPEESGDRHTAPSMHQPDMWPHSHCDTTSALGAPQTTQVTELPSDSRPSGDGISYMDSSLLPEVTCMLPPSNPVQATGRKSDGDSGEPFSDGAQPVCKYSAAAVSAQTKPCVTELEAELQPQLHDAYPCDGIKHEVAEPQTVIGCSYGGELEPHECVLPTMKPVIVHVIPDGSSDEDEPKESLRPPMQNFCASFNISCLDLNSKSDDAGAIDINTVPGQFITAQQSTQQQGSNGIVIGLEKLPSKYNKTDCLSYHHGHSPNTQLVASPLHIFIYFSSRRRNGMFDFFRFFCICCTAQQAICILLALCCRYKVFQQMLHFSGLHLTINFIADQPLVGYSYILSPLSCCGDKQQSSSDGGGSQSMQHNTQSHASASSSSVSSVGNGNISASGGGGDRGDDGNRRRIKYQCEEEPSQHCSDEETSVEDRHHGLSCTGVITEKSAACEATHVIGLSVTTPSSSRAGDSSRGSANYEPDAILLVQATDKHCLDHISQTSHEMPSCEPIDILPSIAPNSNSDQPVRSNGEQLVRLTFDFSSDKPVGINDDFPSWSESLGTPDSDISDELQTKEAIEQLPKEQEDTKSSEIVIGIVPIKKNSRTYIAATDMKVFHDVDVGGCHVQVLPDAVDTSADLPFSSQIELPKSSSAEIAYCDQHKLQACPFLPPPCPTVHSPQPELACYDGQVTTSCSHFSPCCSLMVAPFITTLERPSVMFLPSPPVQFPNLAGTAVVCGTSVGAASDLSQPCTMVVSGATPPIRPQECVCSVLKISQVL